MARGGFRLDAGGRTLTVTVTTSSGGTPTCYTGSTSASTQSLPATISADTSFFFDGPEELTISVKTGGGAEIASSNGGTIPFSVRNGQFSELAPSVDRTEFGAVDGGAFVAIPTVAQSATLYVSPSLGSDSNDGRSWGKAKATIAAAVAAAPINGAGGCVIKLSPVTHSLTTDLVLPQNLWLEGSGNPVATGNGTFIEWDGPDTNTYAITTASDTSGLDSTGQQIRNLQMRCGSTKPGGGSYAVKNGLHLRNLQNMSSTDTVEVHSFPGVGVLMDGTNGVTPLRAYPGFVKFTRLWSTHNGVNLWIKGGFTSVLFDLCGFDSGPLTTDICIIDPPESATTRLGKDGVITFLGCKFETSEVTPADYNYFTVNGDTNLAFIGCGQARALPGTKPFVNYTLAPNSTNNDPAGSIPLSIIASTFQNIQNIVKDPTGAVLLKVPVEYSNGEVFQVANWNGQDALRPAYNGTPAPALHGYKMWTFDPAGLTNQLLGSAGVTRGWKMRVPVACTPASLTVHVNTAGATVANAFVGLYNSAGTLIGVSADISTSLQSVGEKIVPITVVGGQSLALAKGDVCYAAIVIGSAGTMPTMLATAGAASATGNNVGLTAAQGYRSWSSGTGATALPSTVSLAACGQLGFSMFVGVK